MDEDESKENKITSNNLAFDNSKLKTNNNTHNIINLSIIEKYFISKKRNID